jgi:cell division topological specificity factor
MIDFLSRFFRREEASKTLAKERLRLILMADRVSLAPDMFDAMKGEMLEVLRRYLEIDEHGMDVHFENAERQFALMANIPVREVRTHDAIAAHVRRPAATAPAPLETPRDFDDPGTELLVSAEQARPPQRRRRKRRPRAATTVVSPQTESPQTEPPPEQDAGSQPPLA